LLLPYPWLIYWLGREDSNLRMAESKFARRRAMYFGSSLYRIHRWGDCGRHLAAIVVFLSVFARISLVFEVCRRGLLSILLNPRAFELPPIQGNFRRIE